MIVINKYFVVLILAQSITYLITIEQFKYNMVLINVFKILQFITLALIDRV